MGQQATTRRKGAQLTRVTSSCPISPRQEPLPLQVERPSLTARNPRIIQQLSRPKREVVQPKVIHLEDELPRRRLRVETSHISILNPGFGRTIGDIARLLFVPASAVVVLGAIALYLSQESFEPKSAQAQIAQITEDEGPVQLAEASEALNPEIEVVAAETRSSFFADLTERLASLGSDTPRAQTADVEDLKSKVKFISGLIAMHRPTIQDCGEVAKIIVETSVREKVDPFFLAAVISIESRFANDARSSVGARGLMQLMPATARALKGARNNGAIHAQLHDTRTNIDLGVQYLRTLQTKYRGDKTLALSAYNWGPGNVDRARKDGKRIPGSVLKYASTILSRSKNWSNHFEKAKASALELEGVYTAS